MTDLFVYVGFCHAHRGKLVHSFLYSLQYSAGKSHTCLLIMLASVLLDEWRKSVFCRLL